MLVSNPLCEKMQTSAVAVPLLGRCNEIALPPRVHVLLLVTNGPNAATFKSRSLAGTETPAVVGSTTTMSLMRSEEHTSELQSHLNLVCRLLLEKKKNIKIRNNIVHASYARRHP